MVGNRYGTVQSGNNAAPPAVYASAAFNTSVSNFDIGPARSDRIIVVAAQVEDDTTRQTSAPTISGVTLLPVYNPTEPDNEGMWYAVIPTGTTLTITGGKTRSAYWVLTGVTGLEAQPTGSSATSNIALSVNPTKSAVVCAIARSRSSMGASSPNASGSLGTPTLLTSSTSGGGNSGWMAVSALAAAGGSGTLNMQQANAYSSGTGGGGVFT